MSHESHRAPSRDPSGNDFFAGLGPPTVPAGLGHRVLAQARRSAGDTPRRRPLVDRLWESRPLWVAWAAGVVLLLGGQLMLVRSTPVAHRQMARGVTSETPGPRSPSLVDDAEVAALLGRHPIRDSGRGPGSNGLRPMVSLGADFFL